MTSRTTKKKHGIQDSSNAEAANHQASMTPEGKEACVNTDKNQESIIMGLIIHPVQYGTSHNASVFC